MARYAFIVRLFHSLLSTGFKRRFRSDPDFPNEKNKENIAEYMKEYYAKNRDHLREYKTKNRERIAEYMKGYYAKNKERMKEYTRTHRTGGISKADTQRP